jgi:hypothetical protein
MLADQGQIDEVDEHAVQLDGHLAVGGGDGHMELRCHDHVLSVGFVHDTFAAKRVHGDGAQAPPAPRARCMRGSGRALLASAPARACRRG